MIPKTIHYCWFGGNPLGETELKCINSWKEYLPDYRIIKWDESNFNINSCRYASEAYELRKWAFLSDYARFKILYEYGGLYFDTDVEIISSLNDIINQGPFLGIEFDKEPFSSNKPDFYPTVNPGLGMASNKCNEFYYEILRSYEDDRFIYDDNSLNEETVVTRTTNLLRRYGLKPSSGIQNICGINIYPAEYFNPKNFLTGNIETTVNTRTIHHFSMSWLSAQKKRQFEIQSNLLKIGFNYKLSHFISAILSRI